MFISGLLPAPYKGTGGQESQPRLPEPETFAVHVQCAPASAPSPARNAVPASQTSARRRSNDKMRPLVRMPQRMRPSELMSAVSR